MVKEPKKKVIRSQLGDQMSFSSLKRSSGVKINFFSTCSKPKSKMQHL